MNASIQYHETFAKQKKTMFTLANVNWPIWNNNTVYLDWEERGLVLRCARCFAHLKLSVSMLML